MSSSLACDMSTARENGRAGGRRGTVTNKNKAKQLMILNQINKDAANSSAHVIIWSLKHHQHHDGRRLFRDNNCSEREKHMQEARRGNSQSRDTVNLLLSNHKTKLNPCYNIKTVGGPDGALP